MLTDNHQINKAHVRWMIRRDMVRVLEIENESFDYPWSEVAFHQVLRQRNCIAMVAEAGDNVIGYMVYEMHRYRLHLLNFAVCPFHRRTGIGKQLMEKLKSKLSWGRRSRINCEIREANLEAQLWFKAHGFRCLSILKDFYDDTTEDAYLFSFQTAGGPSDGTD